MISIVPEALLIFILELCTPSFLEKVPDISFQDRWRRGKRTLELALFLPKIKESLGKTRGTITLMIQCMPCNNETGHTAQKATRFGGESSGCFAHIRAWFPRAVSHLRERACSETTVASRIRESVSRSSHHLKLK